LPVTDLPGPGSFVPAVVRDRQLKSHLDRFLATFSFDDHVSMDPVQFVRA
jgi:hypothetical protein